MYIFRKIHANEQGNICGISYSLPENKDITHKDKWLYRELPLDKQIKWNPNDEQIGTIILSEMAQINSV